MNIAENIKTQIAIKVVARLIAKRVTAQLREGKNEYLTVRSG